VCDGVIFEKVILFVAKFQEAHDVCSRGVHDMDCHSSISGDDGISLQRHHQRSLCTVRYLQRLLYGESGAANHNFRRIHSAAGTDGFLLFSHHILATYQGKMKQEKQRQQESHVRLVPIVFGSILYTIVKGISL